MPPGRLSGLYQKAVTSLNSIMALRRLIQLTPVNFIEGRQNCGRATFVPIFGLTKVNMWRA